EGADERELGVGGPGELRTSQRRVLGTGAMAGEIGPARVSPRAEHPRAGLELRSDLSAGKPSARVQAELLWIDNVAEEIIREAGLGFLSPSAAAMGAEIETGPGQDHHRRGRGIHDRWGAIQVGVSRGCRLQGSGQGCHSYACDGQSFHRTSPPTTALKVFRTAGDSRRAWHARSVAADCGESKAAAAKGRKKRPRCPLMECSYRLEMTISFALRCHRATAANFRQHLGWIAIFRCDLRYGRCPPLFHSGRTP